MARIRNPLLQGSSGPVASSGFSVAPPEPANGALGGIAQAIAGLVGAATYDPERDPRVQQGEYYKAQTEGKRSEMFAGEQISNIIAGISQMDPETQARVTREALSAAARGGLKPADIAATIQALVPNMGGTDDQIVRSRMGTGGTTLGPDQSVSIGGQEKIRRDNERMADEDRQVTEGGLNSRNAATIAGALARTNVEEGGRMARRFDGTVNTPQGTTTTFNPDDPRRPQAPAATPDMPSPPRPNTFSVPPKANTVSEVVAGLLQEGKIDEAKRAAEAGKGITPRPAVDLRTVDELDGEINAQIGFELPNPAKGIKGQGTPMSPKLQAQVRERAAVLMQAGDNPVMAVRKALDELTEEYQPPNAVLPNWVYPKDKERVPRRAPLGVPPAPGREDPLGIRG